jgi:hypothetical protein
VCVLNDNKDQIKNVSDQTKIEDLTSKGSSDEGTLRGDKSSFDETGSHEDCQLHHLE